jgi:ribosome-associated protein
METFEISGDYIELNKLLKAAGCCPTGGMAKLSIADGLVEVDGIVEYRTRCKIRNGQGITFAGRTIRIVQSSR